MNSYDDNLRESLTRSLGALADQQAALLHGRSQAEADLYHAKGAVLAARDRLEADQRHRDERRTVHHGARRAHDQATALYNTLVLAKSGSDSAITNTATAAKNLQSSADAIMQLASTIGAALNVASAALYDTELYHQIARVNTNLNRVANQARFLALKGTEVSSKCAESIVGALTDQGAGVQARLGDLLTQVQASLDTKVAAVNNDETALNTALADEFSAHNVLRETVARHETMSTMLTNARRYANMDLRVDVLTAKQIKVYFTPFKAPVATGDRPMPPSPKPKIFLAIVPQNLAAPFSTDRAAQLFSKWDGVPGNFTPVDPGETVLSLKRDVYGNTITSDTAYTAFLYIEPSVEYKRYLGNFGDYLSLSSAPFTPLTPLPGPVFAGVGQGQQQLLLAVADDGQAGGSSGPLLSALEEGAAELDELAAWLQANGAILPPDLALALDAVVPPFVALLKADIAALRAGRSGGGNASVSVLLTLLDTTPEPTNTLAELGSLRRLLPELGRLMAKAAQQESQIGSKLDLRCILIDEAIDNALADPARKDLLPPYFTVDTARGVAPANYVQAQPLADPPAGATPPASLQQDSILWYAVDITPENKDCFGNPLLPGHRYAPVILATLRGSDASGWQDTLTRLHHVWHCT
ncbi:hypothetical protein CHU95_05270 [Niveispirillum lacus]|uniref:Uncharacterized protein n=1 Tax=Niveispirillum lacus TaxID=1981099 RepID=A0A255Z450_9PROT|nr:hypothetical protein [Niveispirillum lacus]OYQ36201.1 hypothetical protein CHU95_05270 [Niveispirillum lacus]